jgi:predicted nucleic acid-binding protein
MLVVDTSAWIDYLRGTDSSAAILLDQRIGQMRIILPDLVLAEILRGLQTDALARSTQQILLEFEMVTIGGHDIAIKAATNYRILRSIGVTIRGTIDLLIATWCIENKIPLLHSDRDFTAMERHLGLQSIL